jgi:hypothetical protein
MCHVRTKKRYYHTINTKDVYKYCESKKHLILKGFISGIVNFAYERLSKNLMVILRPPCVSLLINDQT